MLLDRLADAACVNVTALRRSEPSLVQRLECLAASVQEAVVASRGYWEELRKELAAQRVRRPARMRVVRRS